ncbi:site-specific DNA-methyltransferase [Roseiconus nitratireducens]|uniref:Site-specific DNA-methyltransferase n=1 Tax=Roseiconus nitratireducens TaxID=2605748 RepID=A0A5M6CTL2_9BACT|nr:DNA methyltransferase [Roseiconus nitratireducens]KAA5538597.1 site-specific DNA-methyltransferase [Roseiconus nitratireducens]
MSSDSQMRFSHTHEGSENAQIECLGKTFPDETARQQHFRELLREKLSDPGFRSISGFPVGNDDDILAMSDPPFYTACPNPFLGDFIEHFGTNYGAEIKYHREPFTADVSEGKTDPIYTAHAYHTKVPYKAIMRYILQYTNPGDLVFDGFCGTGMTGIAAQMCGDRQEIEKLGYRVTANGQVLEQRNDSAGNSVEISVSRVGERRAVLNDLSPAASFIAGNYGQPIDEELFRKEAKRILHEIDHQMGWMFETHHSDGKTIGRINFTVWSDVFSCGECGEEIVFVDEALDTESGSIRDAFPCPRCGTESRKNDLELRYESSLDKATGSSISLPKRVPVLIDYTAKGKRYTKKPDEADLAVLRRIAESPLPSHLPTLELPDMQMRRVGRMQPSHITHIHHFFLPRPARWMSALWEKAISVSDHRLRRFLLYFVEQAIWTASLVNRYRPTGYSQVNQYLTGVFYIPSQHAECSPWYVLEGKAKRLTKLFSNFQPKLGNTIVTTQDLSAVGLPDNSIDYIFTDPPFGENIYYSDLNILIESWHGVLTATDPEAIVDRVKQKTLIDYQRMMSDCFSNYYRVLKPGRWMTVEFHNSRNSVWNAIQEALQHAGFVVADVRTLDKQQGSFQQVVSGNTVKRDLIISAYKPNGGLEERFQTKAGTEEAVWDFVSTHLRQLPVFVSRDGKAEPVTERQPYLLFDRMVAFHVQRGYPIPMSSPEFHDGLRQNFPERDGMYFLSDQVSEYDRRRLEVDGVGQLQLFVSDEKSAIQWVRQQLKDQPRGYQDLSPIYMKEAQRVWEKHEQPLELTTILEQNFVKDSEGIWHVPDLKNESHLEQLRHRTLIKEFQQYIEAKGKLKVVRTEALRAGFKEAWQEKDYKTIVQMAKRVPDAVIQEDQALLMYFDNASLMLGE